MSRLVISLILLVFGASSGIAVEKQADPRTVKFPPLNYRIPPAERVVLDCGAPVWLLRDTELPIVNITAMVHVGSVYEPAGKTGLADMAASLIRTGGADGIAAEQLDDELEFMASSIESRSGSDMGTVSLSTLKKNLPRTLQLFRKILYKPEFDPKRTEMVRRQLVEGLRRQNDDPKDIAIRELLRSIYAGHPLGHIATHATISSVSRDDLINWHKKFYRPDNMILAVSGDFDRDTMLAELNAVFRPEGGALSPLNLPEAAQPKPALNGEIIYGRKETSQTVIRMGHLGISKDSPDIYAIRLLDYILGGSFTSRLTMEIRTNRGLAYSAGSHFDIGRRVAGTYIAETETKAESTLAVIGMIREIVAGITREPVTEAELNSAKEYTINSFMFGFTTAASIVTQRARLEFYGYPEGYLEEYRDNIAKVTRGDILAAAKRHLRPDNMTLVVVGDEGKFEKPLNTLGPVRVLDLKLNIP